MGNSNINKVYYKFNIFGNKKFFEMINNIYFENKKCIKRHHDILFCFFIDNEFINYNVLEFQRLHQFINLEFDNKTHNYILGYFIKNKIYEL